MVLQQRQVIDYALARRATLAELARGQRSAADVCDAHPDLQRAARYYGEATDTGCPICRKSRLTKVTYAYGDELQHASGRARPSRSLSGLASRFARVQIYEVEVCRSCSWNHLLVSYVIGTGPAQASTPATATKKATAASEAKSEPKAASGASSQQRERRTARR